MSGPLFEGASSLDVEGLRIIHGTLGNGYDHGSSQQKGFEAAS